MEPVLTIPQIGTSRYGFDRRFPHGRYRDLSTGRFVSWDAVRRMLDAVLDGAEGDVAALSERLRRGEITLREWQAGMEQHVRAVHTASYALQRGGFRNMSAADFDALRRRLFNPEATRDRATWGEMQHLRRFARQIASGEQPLNGHVARRARAYTRASRATYHEAERRLMQERGFDEERFRLNPADHCSDGDGQSWRPPRRGCLERADAGWTPMGTWATIGGMACGPNDRCSVLYRNARTGQVWP